MKIWIVSREYAGIAEAGGVKNVTWSLAEELVRTGSSVTVFLPLYGCTDFSNIKDRKDYIVSNASFTVNGINETVSYSSASMMIDKDSGKEVHFVFVVSSL